MNKYKEKGTWWVKDAPDVKLTGVLKFSKKEGIRLSLDGVFLHNVNLDIIHGYTKTGDEVTLYKSFIKQQTLSTSPYEGESTVRSQMLFIGHLFNEEPTFNKIKFRTTSLDNWVNLSGFDIDLDLSNNRINVLYEMADDIVIYTDESKSMLINRTVRTPVLSFVQKSANLEQKTYFKIQYGEDVSYVEILKLLYKLQIFLSLGVNEPIFPLEIYCYSSNATEPYGNNDNSKKIDVRYSPSGSFETKDIIPFDMLFSYGDIKDSIEEKMDLYFQCFSKLEPIFELYLTDIYGFNKSLSSKFMSLIQALEGYHRRISTEIDIPLLEHEVRMSKILESAPEEYREWLKSKLHYSNEISLRKRLKELYDKYKPIFEDKVKKKSLVNYALNTRNYYTHYDSSLKNSIADGKKLIYLNRHLRLMLVCVLLTEIGFTIGEVINIASKLDFPVLKRT